MQDRYIFLSILISSEGNFTNTYYLMSPHWYPVHIAFQMSQSLSKESPWFISEWGRIFVNSDISCSFIMNSTFGIHTVSNFFHVPPCCYRGLETIENLKIFKFFKLYFSGGLSHRNVCGGSLNVFSFSDFDVYFCTAALPIRELLCKRRVIMGTDPILSHPLLLNGRYKIS
ncbi:hypothetical protein TPHA_0H01320 [Tetrapisispora phaffii CBS 4417]|uniref:Uncharacterized protein n=1 Tax=Tetrapisispora phaffii (strain ATCC 24235 / CBS 4417 / NBRC 1672 / NRRL Y-8282 / UCD 70-5) TaxID=1071381 RepID=G8BX35_TETPH|nr:hypothetical protein TPHA_0H01320 [Tetrapisispora phaffii CBS 4417]CCE64339.1 hypothetical protein TPHA_0H01320 [Tetrapisispora phaffii CBS 4417]